MNESQVKQQIQQMVSFIRQEAEEKANEIRVKAEEDFNIRKLSAVEAAREKIRAEYERKTKQIEINQKIAYSTELNASRLKILKARDEILREIYDEADRKLADGSTNTATYGPLLKNLILQGLLMMLDSDVLIRCRDADVPTVKSTLPDIASTYKSKTGKEVRLILDDKDSLSKHCTGGATLFSKGGKIMLENTFEARLEIAYQQNLPFIRKMLFGDKEL